MNAIAPSQPRRLLVAATGFLTVGATGAGVVLPRAADGIAAVSAGSTPTGIGSIGDTGNSSRCNHRRESSNLVAWIEARIPRTATCHRNEGQAVSKVSSPLDRGRSDGSHDRGTAGSAGEQTAARYRDAVFPLIDRVVPSGVRFPPTRSDRSPNEGRA